MEYNIGSVRKWQLSCCALCQLTASNLTPKEELEQMISDLKSDAKEIWNSNNRFSGERACFVIVTPHEPNLEKNLLELGFTNTFEFDRRNGYPATGKLKMYCLNW